jgi:phosphoenolpyruvate synthase/pyruvate phosphate dikinase
LFTIEPVTGDQDQLVLEVVRGLGDRLVSGSVNPERYAVDKESCSILRFTPGDEMGVPMLSSEVISMICRVGLTVEQALGFPQDIEWAIENGELFVLQSRPITTYQRQ